MPLNPNHSTRVSGQYGYSSSGRNPHEALIEAVDASPEVRGAGIMLVDEWGVRTEVRGGPRRLWVWIVPGGSGGGESGGNEEDESGVLGFLSRWSGPILNCGSAGVAWLAIGMTKGVASIAVGALAVNSTALCISSVGKSYYRDEVRRLELESGAAAGSYQAWLKAEYLLELIDLCNGMKGVVKLFRHLRFTGKLPQLEKALSARRFAAGQPTRRELLDLIAEIDPYEAALLRQNFGKGVARGKIVGLGNRILQRGRALNLPEHRRVAIADAVGGVLSGAGWTLGKFQSATAPTVVPGMRRQWEVWVLEQAH